MRSLARLTVLLALASLMCGCWPGRCQGGFRGLLPREDNDGVLVVTPDASFSMNADSRADRSPAQLLADSGFTEASVILEGPSGPVAVELTARLVAHAHSCASAATLSVRPRAALSSGEYTLAVLLDEAKWPAVGHQEIATWHGHRALIRRYRVH